MRKRRTIPFVLSLFFVFAAAFAVMAVLVSTDRVYDFDQNLIDFVQSAEGPYLTVLAKALSLIGSSKIAIGLSLVIMVLLYSLLKHRKELVLFLWVGVGSHLLNTLLKWWFHRERPNIHRLIEEVGFSFPSGHSMAAFSLYGVVAYLLWRHTRFHAERVLLIAGAVLITLGIGWSRIYLGVHYPSDVIGGYLASAAWLMLSIAGFEAWRNKRLSR